MYTMDYMIQTIQEKSTLHLKVDHAVHIGAKIMAAKRATTMNQYVADLIIADMEGNDMPILVIQEGIDLYRKATSTEKKHIQKAAEVVDSLVQKESLQAYQKELEPIVVRGNPRTDTSKMVLHKPIIKTKEDAITVVKELCTGHKMRWDCGRKGCKGGGN